MKQIELLNDDDLRYFRRKAQEGKVVILELSEEQLLNLNFEYWKGQEKNIFKETEVINWLCNNGIVELEMLKTKQSIVGS